MKKKIVISISIVFVLLMAMCLGIKFYYAQKNNQDITLDQSKYAEIEFNTNGYQYALNEQTYTISIQEYHGNEDCIVVPEEISGYAVENIDENSFSECYNLEVIKLPKAVAKKINEIPNFEINRNDNDNKYVTYTTTREYSEIYKEYLVLTAEEKESLAIIPNKFDVPMEKVYSSEMERIYGTNIEKIDETETSYDLRNDIKIEVEDQEDYGNCYAYASLSSVETNIALTRNELVDFSEVHAAVMTTGYGGNFFTSANGYYANKLGPVYEEDFAKENIYNNTSDRMYQLIDIYLKGSVKTELTLTNAELQEIQEFARQKSGVEYITETIQFPSITSQIKSDENYVTTIADVRAKIKNHIKTYGSIAASVSMEGCTEYNGNVVLNNKSATIYDHGVSIVGWDDDFAKENFPESCRPNSDGAYLVLNSWGEDWGQEGYFWVSYEDKFIESNLYGVIRVEDISEKMEASDMIVTELDTNNLIESFQIEKGKKVQITTDILVNYLTSGAEVKVSLKNHEKDVSECMTVSGTKIINNVANVTANIDTASLEIGNYILETTYGEEKIYKSLIVTSPAVYSTETDITTYSSGDYEYSINEDGTITLTNYLGTATEIVVPSEYDGYTVSAIGTLAFSGMDITKVEISRGIKKIEDTAFYLCTSLTTVILPEVEKTEDGSIPEDALTFLGKQSFANCTNLTSINLPWTINFIDEFAFQQCSSLTSITLPESLTSIERGLFLSCTKLSNVQISENVTTIQRGVFQQCTSLTFIKIPRNVTTLYEDIFMKCTNLQTVVIFKETTTMEGDSMFKNCYFVTIFGENIDDPETEEVEMTAAEKFATENYIRFQYLDTFKITYDGNAGNANISNLPTQQSKMRYEDVKISENVPARYGYLFKGWGTAVDSTTASYQPGDIFNLDQDITLYAIWDEDPNITRINIADFVFEDTSVTYNGNERIIESTGQDESIVDVTYTVEALEDSELLNEKAVNVGTYLVTATYTIKERTKLYIYK